MYGVPGNSISPNLPVRMMQTLHHNRLSGYEKDGSGSGSGSGAIKSTSEPFSGVDIWLLFVVPIPQPYTVPDYYHPGQ